jgi:hypothetical protein
MFLLLWFLVYPILLETSVHVSLLGLLTLVHSLFLDSVAMYGL